MASNPGPMMEIIGRVAFELMQMRPLLPTYLHLLVSAIFPIYTGAHASLARPPSAAKPQKRARKESKDGESSEDDEDELQIIQKIESLTAWDALTFPLLAGATLSSLYFLLKWLEDPAILNKILAVYFAQMGMFFGVKFLKDLFSTIRSVLLPTQYSTREGVWYVDTAAACFKTKSKVANSHQSPFPGWLRNTTLPNKLSAVIWKIRRVIYTKATLRLDIHKLLKVRSPIDIIDILSLAIVMSILAWQTFVSTPWYLTNFMGFSFCYGSLQMVTPTTGSIGTLVLSALFIYDIYFVFFTPMMVTVATKLEVPIKLLFPRPDGCVKPFNALEGSDAMQMYLECVAKKRTMAMLGLGDIVIPGMMLAFALRFDLYRFYLRLQSVPVEDPSVGESEKKKYTRATGGWGERLWTARKLRSDALQAKTFPKTYFHAGIIGYLTGMILTVVVMQVAQHAQPALLYLVPCVLISLWGTALVRGELKLLWMYTEADEEEEKDKKSEGESKDDNTGKRKNDEATKVDGVEKDEADGTKAATPDKHATNKTEDKTKATRSKSPLSLISFSITLPPSKTTPSISPRSSRATQTSSIPSHHTDDVKPNNSNNNISDHNVTTSTHTTKPPSSTASSSDSSYDVLPDVKADHEVMDKLSREITWAKGAEASASTSSATAGGEGGEGARKRVMSTAAVAVAASKTIPTTGRDDNGNGDGEPVGKRRRKA